MLIRGRRQCCATGASVVLSLMLSAEAQALDFAYTNTNGTITITGYTGPGGAITIPGAIDGLPVTSITGDAFQYRTSVTSVTIPNSVTNIEDGSLWKGGGAGTFWYCTGLSNITIGNGVAHIGFGAFQDCSSLIRVTVPDSVTSIGDFAFHGCTNLTAVTIGKNVTSIGIGFGYAFAGCPSLVSALFQGNAPAANPNTFEDDNNLTVYYLPGTTGWGAWFGDNNRPTAPWTTTNPLILTTNPSFGLRTNRFGFLASSATNLPFVVEGTTDLVNPAWQPVQTVPTGGSFYFSDPQWTNYPSRFYRIRSP